VPCVWGSAINVCKNESVCVCLGSRKLIPSTRYITAMSHCDQFHSTTIINTSTRQNHTISLSVQSQTQSHTTPIQSPASQSNIYTFANNTFFLLFNTMSSVNFPLTPESFQQSSPRLSPGMATDPFEPRGRDASPRRSGLYGRKGYNAPVREATPPPSSRSTSPLPPHRDGLFGRKGYNSTPSSSRESSPAPDGLFGRKGYNASPAQSRESSPAPYSRDGLKGRKGYNAELPLVEAQAMSRSRSQSVSPAPHHRESGLTGRKGYNASPALPQEVATKEGLKGRKGYNAETPAIDVHDARSRSTSTSSVSEFHKHREGGLTGRKGYNASPIHSAEHSPVPSPHSGHSSPNPDGRLGSGRKGYNSSPRSESSHVGVRGRKGYNEGRDHSHESHVVEQVTESLTGLGIRDMGLTGRRDSLSPAHAERRGTSPSPRR
jgi:hypothetical protein